MTFNQVIRVCDTYTRLFIIMQLFISLFILNAIKRDDETATMFKPQQLVRVYNANAKLLFVGTYMSDSGGMISLCDIVWKAGGPPFKPQQCLIVNAKQFIVAAAREPGVTWKEE